MEYSTRISDLPENITLGPMQTNFALENGLDIPPLPGTYTQMNVHPNPYGQGPPQQGAIPPPQQTFVHKGQGQSQAQNPYLGNNDQPVHLRNMPQHPLPIRDVVKDTTYYQQDEAIQPNYIPRNRDPEADETYVYEQEDRIKRQKRAKKQKMFSDWKWDDIVAELQTPIIIAVLFLVFQSPTLHVLMARYLNFLQMFGEGGDLNVTGILFKSALFGFAYFSLMRFMNYIDQ